MGTNSILPEDGALPAGYKLPTNPQALEAVITNQLVKRGVKGIDELNALGVR